MLQPERFSSHANEVKKSHAEDKSDDRGPYLERKIQDLHVEEKRNAVAKQRNEDDKLPVGIDYAKAHYREIDLRPNWTCLHVLLVSVSPDFPSAENKSLAPWERGYPWDPPSSDGVNQKLSQLLAEVRVEVDSVTLRERKGQTRYSTEGEAKD